MVECTFYHHAEFYYLVITIFPRAGVSFIFMGYMTGGQAPSPIFCKDFSADKQI